VPEEYYLRFCLWLWHVFPLHGFGCPPKDMLDFAQSLAAVSIFSSNLYFLSKSNYFDIDAELKPSLHTWSLAVEEQYYVFFHYFSL